jgi:hypothetical protein
VIKEASADYGGACGFVTRDGIRGALENIEEKSYFICGPMGLYEFCLPELETLGIPRRKIKQEMYGAPPNIWEYPGWPRQVGKDAVFSLKIKSGKELEDLIERRFRKSQRGKQLDVSSIIGGKDHGTANYRSAGYRFCSL